MTNEFVLVDYKKAIRDLDNDVSFFGAHALFETAQKTENLLRGKTQGNVQEYIEELLSVYDSTEKEFKLIRMRF